MEDLWMYVIPLVLTVVVGYIAGKRAELRAFCKELGEALLATEIYLGLDNPTKEDTESFRREWAEAVKAGGNLFGKIVVLARKRKYPN